MAERFNGRIAEIVNFTRFHSGRELEQTLLQYAKVYNHQIPQKALGHISPVQALKNWQAKRLELFKKRVYNLTGLDTYMYHCHILEHEDGGMMGQFVVVP